MRFICNLCDKEFGNIEELFRHVVEYHKVKEEALKVSICRYVYPDIGGEAFFKYLSQFGFSRFYVLEVKCVNNWFEIEVFIPEGNLDWEQVGKFLKNISSEREVSIIDVYIDWRSVYYTEYRGLVIELWIDIREVVEFEKNSP